MPGPQHDPSAATGEDGSAAGPGTNWAGNHVYTAGRYVRARSLDEAQEVINSSRRVRLLGTRHSFNALCDTDGTLLDLTGLAAEPALDRERGTVRVAGGTPYNDVAAHLQAHGFALPTWARCPTSRWPAPRRRARTNRARRTASSARASAASTLSARTASCVRSRAASGTSTAPSSPSAPSAPSCRSTSTSSRRTTYARTSTRTCAGAR